MTATPGSVARTGSAERVYVARFARVERAIHWIHALAFFALLGTGVALYLPSLAGSFGSRATLKALHLYVAGGWLVALLMLVAVSDRRTLARTLRELERFDRDDLRWLRGRPAPQGRFNAGQKAHAVVQGAFAVLFVVSGLLLLRGETNTRFRLSGTILLHDGLTVAATLLVLAHMYLALVHPRTRPALRGMLRGSVRADWALEHHSKWDTVGAGSAAASRSSKERRSSAAGSGSDPDPVSREN